LTTPAGDLELRIPKLRSGSFFPSLLERRRRVDQALFAVVMEAYLHGVSTRKVDDLVKALGADSGISKSEVSRICADLDEEITAFRDRSLASASFPYVFLDATYCKARVNRRVVSQAVVVATGVRGDGWREVLGFAVGDSEDGAFWTAFLRSLKARGLTGVQLVISDAHTGLKQAIGAVLAGAGWQRCRVHFLRNALAYVPKSAAQMAAATIRTAFAQPDPQDAREQWRKVADSFRARFGRLAALLDEVEALVPMLKDAPELAPRTEALLAETSLLAFPPRGSGPFAAEEATAQELTGKLAALRRELLGAADGLVIESLRELDERLRALFRQTRLVHIDAVVGRKKRLEIEIAALRAGRYPAGLYAKLKSEGALGDDEEYWPFEGEYWSDEYENFK
jgi:hypothetical protein